MLTGSKYDHAAMVIKVEQNPEEVLILESTVDEGVHLSRFLDKKSFIGTYFNFMAYRKITISNDQNAYLDRLSQFCKESDGKKYSLTNFIKKS